MGCVVLCVVCVRVLCGCVVLCVRVLCCVCVCVVCFERAGVSNDSPAHL